MKSIIVSVALLISITSHAQQFISKGVIEYEVKTNVVKTLGTSSWAEMLKDNMSSQFKTGFYTLTFADNKSIFKFDHWDAGAKVPEFLRKSDEENSWYFDHNTGKYIMQKNVYGSNFNVEDSVRNIEWKLSNESRIIAGFNCRKAVGVIMDSVYVFAFYTDEITLSGGPCSISGLPGTILGLTIPRMYTSYIATKITLTNVNEASIKPASAKKYMNTATLKSTLKERVKDWSSDDDEDSKKWIAQLYWSTLL
jgi:GLPGLI family protein